MLGGYTYNQDQYDAALIQTISDVLKDKQARQIPLLYSHRWGTHY